MTYDVCCVVDCLNDVAIIGDGAYAEDTRESFDFPEGGGRCKSCDEVACDKHFDQETKRCTECGTCHICKKRSVDGDDLYTPDGDWKRIGAGHTACRVVAIVTGHHPQKAAA